MPNPFNTADGQYVGDGAAKTVTLGFQPGEVNLVDTTNNKHFYVTAAMPATYTQEIQAGVTTSASDLAITATGFTVSAATNANLAVLTYWAVRRES